MLILFVIVHRSDEIGRAFVIVGKPLKDTDILAWLDEFDADGNGIIDEDEFAHMVRNRCVYMLRHRESFCDLLYD